MTTAACETHELLFDDERHAYTLDGRPVAGVTGMIDQTLRKPELERWQAWVGEEEATRIRDESCERGSVIHDLLAFVAGGGQYVDFSGDPYPVAIASAMEAQLAAAVDEIFAVELPVASVIWQYAGTVDLIYRKPGRRTYTLVDYKSAKAVWPSHLLQTAAYVEAAREWFGIKIGDREIWLLHAEEELVDPISPPIVRVSITPHPYKDQAADFAAFASLLQVHRWQKNEHH
jgi:hypothetical protein